MIIKERQSVHHLSLLEKIPEERKMVMVDVEPTTNYERFDKATGQFTITRKEEITNIDDFKERTKPVNILKVK